jgi:hypothetical protein
MGTCFMLRRRHLGVSQAFPHVADSLSVQHIAVVRAMQNAFDSIHVLEYYEHHAEPVFQ